jgi:hypothetical protein
MSFATTWWWAVPILLLRASYHPASLEMLSGATAHPEKRVVTRARTDLLVVLAGVSGLFTIENAYEE